MSAKRFPVAQQKTRVLTYIDGFNIYYGLRHACRDADHYHLTYGGDPSGCLGRSLYWLDLEAMVLGQLKRSEQCVGVKYFSAPRRIPRLIDVPNPAHYAESNARQNTFFDAIRTNPNIDLVLGWYSENTPVECGQCGYQWPNFEEKVTDVNIATHLIRDAFEDRFDRAFLISADADLVPPVEAVREIGKEVVVGLFPGRKRAKHLREASSEIRGIKINYLRGKRLPDIIDRENLPPLECPKEWRSPGGWVWSGPAPSPTQDGHKDATLPDAPKG